MMSDEQAAQPAAQPTTFDDKTELRGLVALVTGASSGIGQAIAEALVRRGAHVALGARRVERLQALMERLASEAAQARTDDAAAQAGAYGETLAVQCDVRNPEDVQALVAAALARWGQLDILVANAGLGNRAPLVEGDPERWKTMLDTNVYGLALTLKYGAPPLIERKRGHVIVMSSVAGRVVTLGGAVYCATKAAASTIAEGLRMELAPQGVRVTCIEPGVVISEFQAVALYTPDIVANMLKGGTPLYPADIARTVISALEQPPSVDLGEIVIRGTHQAYP